MTDNNAIPANSPALPNEMTADKTKARIAQFCEWFDLTPPKLKTRLGRVYMTDELLEWFNTSGASIDWVISGEVRGMAVAFRRNVLQEMRAVETFAQFDETERKMLLETLRAIAGNKISTEGAMGACQQVFKERRAEMAAE